MEKGFYAVPETKGKSFNVVSRQRISCSNRAKGQDGFDAVSERNGLIQHQDQHAERFDVMSG